MKIFARYRPGGLSENTRLVAEAQALLRQTHASCAKATKHFRKELALSIRTLRKRARQNAFEQGCAAARRVYAARLLAIETARAALLSQAQTECFQLACEVAQEVLHAELQSNANSIRARITLGLEALRAESIITISVSSSLKNVFADENVGNSHFARIIHSELGDLATPLIVKFDESLPTASICIRTTRGCVLLDPMADLQQIRTHLQSSLESNSKSKPSEQV